MVLSRPLTFVAAAGVAAILIAFAVQAAPRPINSAPSPGVNLGAPRIIEMHASKILLTPDAQLASADAVALLESTGESFVHWNSSDNTEWIGTEAGLDVWIYRDDTFRVVRVLRGNLQGGEVVLRGIGGTVGNVTMTYSSQIDWVAGTTYLVFLRIAETPTREGVERMWAEFDIGQSAFLPDGPGRWINRAKQEVREADISVR